MLKDGILQFRPVHKRFGTCTRSLSIAFECRDIDEGSFKMFGSSLAR